VCIDCVSRCQGRGNLNRGSQVTPSELGADWWLHGGIEGEMEV